MGGDDRPDEWQGPRSWDTETRRRLDELLSVLSERRRRDLLYHLVSTEVTDVKTLAQTLAALQECEPVDEVSPDVLEQVQMNLVHTDLPKLANAGAIEFDPRTEAVRSRELPPMIERLVENCRDIEDEE